MVARLLARVALTLLAIHSHAACGRAAGEPETLRQSLESTASPPRLITDFRTFRLEPIPEAASELEGLLDGGPSVERLERLERIYAEQGYRASERFYRTAAALLRGEPPDLEPLDRSIAWEDLPGDALPETGRVYLEVVELLDRSQAGAAARRAREGLAELGPSLWLGGAWAEAYLSDVDRKGRVDDFADFELALRTALNALEERNPDQPMAAGGHNRMAAIFLRLGDPLSALTSSHLELAALLRPEAEMLPNRELAERQAREKIAALSAEVERLRSDQ